MDWWNTLSTGWWGNVTAGLVSGGLVSLGFYLLGGRQLLRLARQVNLITRGMEQGGVASFARNDSGEAQGLVHEAHLTDSLGASAALRVEGTVTKKEKRCRDFVARATMS